MPRVQLTPRAAIPFATTSSCAPPTSTTAATWATTACSRWCTRRGWPSWRSHGWSELDCGGAALILGDAAVVYQAEAFAGDVLRFEVTACEPGRAGFRLAYRVTRPVDAKAIALVETGMVCFDYGTRRIVPVPAAVAAVCRKEP